MPLKKEANPPNHVLLRDWELMEWKVFVRTSDRRRNESTSSTGCSVAARDSVEDAAWRRWEGVEPVKISLGRTSSHRAYRSSRARASALAGGRPPTHNLSPRPLRRVAMS